MVVPATRMQIQQFASLFNFSAIALVVALSLALLPRFQVAYFRAWVLAQAFATVFLGAEWLASVTARHPALSLLGLTALMGNVLFLNVTRLHLQSRPLPHRLYGLLFVLGWGMMVGLLFTASFEAASLAPALAMSASLIRLGIVVLRQGALEHRRNVTWWGWPLILTGLLPMAFPLVIGTPHAWVGFWLGGLLNVLIGMGMLIFLLQETTNLLQQKNEELVQLDQLKSNFISTMSHEFRTPLTAIKSAAWLLEQGPPESKAEMVGIIMDHADALNRIMSDVLDVSQMEAGLMIYHRQEENVGALVAMVAAGLKPLYQERQVELSLELPGRPVYALLDGDKMSLVIRNLLSNAVKFTPAGGRVQARVSQQDGQARIEVTDTGIGIAPENQARIFEKFYQVDNSRTRRAGGTGLGLTISRSIVEGHGGTLTVSSRPHEGSTFTVGVPAAPEPAADMARTGYNESCH